MKWLRTPALLLSVLFINSGVQTAVTAQHQHPPIDPALLIKAKAAYQAISSKTPPVVIDVRSKQEFDQGHIVKSISMPYAFLTKTKMFPFKKDRMVIAYCGCPHHLSGLSAQYLMQKGYKTVKVIDEGYFGWKQQGLPVVEPAKKPASKTSLEIRGRLLDARQQPMPGRNIFIVHEPSGQTEATRTDEQGNYTMHLHFTNITQDEPLTFKYENKAIQQATFAKLAQGPLDVSVPTENKPGLFSRIWARIVDIFT